MTRWAWRKVAEGKHIVVFLLLIMMYFVLPVSKVSWAHSSSDGYSFVNIDKNAVEYELLLSHSLLLKYDSDHNKSISKEELEEQKPIIEAYMKDHLQLFNNGQPMESEELRLISTIRMEEPVIQFTFRYTSPVDVDELTIRYDAMMNDLEPTHKNNVQVYIDGTMVAHQVINKERITMQYVPADAEQANIRPSILGMFAKVGVLGGHYVLKSLALWILSLSIVLSGDRLRNSLEITIVIAAANMVGYILADQTNIAPSIPWVSWYGYAVILYMAIDAIAKKTLVWHKPAVTLFGLLHGTGTYSYVMNLGILREYKIVVLFTYGVGIFLVLAGLVCVFYTIMYPLKHYSWYRNIVMPEKMGGE